MATTKINGIQIYYEWLPHSTAVHTIVLLHGFLSSSFSFRKLAPLLRKHFSVLTVDWPPFGASEKPKSYIYSYENIAATIDGLIQELTPGQVVLAGHSMGGQLALQLLARRPKAAEKAVLISASSYLPRAKKRFIAASYLPFAEFAVKRRLEKSGVEGNLKQVVWDQSVIDDEMIGGYGRPFEERSIFQGLTRFLRHREADLAPEQLRELSTPCLLIWGEHDRIVPLRIGQQLAADLPNSRLDIIKKAGHLVPEEKPEETAALIAAFVFNS